MEGVSKSLSWFVKKGALTEEKAKDCVGLINPVRELAPFEEADFVVEAVSESEDLKRSIFGALDEVTRPEAILASNTSSISITRIAMATSRPHQVVGMHFMNPPPIMKGMQTSEEAFARAEGLAEALGKTVWRSEDRP